MIPAMAGFHDRDVVLTLLKVLARPGALHERLHEEAIKGLSQLGEYAVDHLIEALNSPKETFMTRRVRQVLLEMEPFPRVKLLLAFTDTRIAIVQQVTEVFIANQKDAETIRFLVNRLLKSSEDHAIFSNILQTLTEMEAEYTMPYLVEVLGQPNWQVIKPLLRACSQPEIILPLLVKDLTDLQRYILVLEVLREISDYPTVLPWLISGLANEDTRQHTRRLIGEMAHTYDGDLLPDIVHLFNPAIARPDPLPNALPEVQRTLQELLTTELAQKSLPALVIGLAEPALREGCVDSLVTLAYVQQRQEGVLQALLEALRNASQRLGAHQTLVKCGQIAAQSVYELLTESDNDLVREAQAILAEMGETAFPYIYQLAHDPEHRAHAQDIFQLIPVEIISKGLLACFASNDREKEETAFYILAMGMDDEDGSRSGSSGLIRALLAQALEHSNSDVCLRTLSALLFFSQSRRADMAQQIVSTLTQTSEEHFRTEYLRSLFLLGKDAIDPLGFAMHTPDLPERVRLEMIGTLSTLGEEEQITEYVKILAAGPNGTVKFLHRAPGLRALGGLLAGGIYNEKKLEEVLTGLSASSKPQDRAAYEFFDVLLGKRNMPELVRLQEVINKQQDDIERLKRLTEQQEEKLTLAYSGQAQGAVPTETINGAMSLQRRLNIR
jgi:HEAT repeat protein